jgi:endogenous inhibitor of DNA gyrase (YacG/DUF329 family)
VSLCPICNAQVLPRARNKAHPFCSTRCKLVDLGKWLDEEYRIPTVEGPSEDGGEHPTEMK